VRGSLLNEELIRAGLSPAVTRFPYSEAMKERFRAAEQDARRRKAGVWSR
jgi:endonuclease YncB( thermonuclease family)